MDTCLKDRICMNFFSKTSLPSYCISLAQTLLQTGSLDRQTDRQTGMQADTHTDSHRHTEHTELPLMHYATVQLSSCQLATDILSSNCSFSLIQLNSYPAWSYAIIIASNNCWVRLLSVLVLVTRTDNVCLRRQRRSSIRNVYQGSRIWRVEVRARLGLTLLGWCWLTPSFVRGGPKLGLMTCWLTGPGGRCWARAVFC